MLTARLGLPRGGLMPDFALREDPWLQTNFETVIVFEPEVFSERNAFFESKAGNDRWRTFRTENYSEPEFVLGGTIM